MEQEQKRKRLTVVIDGVPKVVTTSELSDLKGCSLEAAQALMDLVVAAHSKSGVFGLGGSTVKKLKAHFSKELKEFTQLNKTYPNNSKTVNFAAAFGINDSNAPCLMDAMRWIEKHIGDEGFSSRTICLESLLADDVLGSKINRGSTTAPYDQLVLDFKGWSGEKLAKAELSVSIIRFLKFFYSQIQ